MYQLDLRRKLNRINWIPLTVPTIKPAKMHVKMKIGAEWKWASNCSPP